MISAKVAHIIAVAFGHENALATLVAGLLWPLTPTHQSMMVPVTAGIYLRKGSY